MLVVVVLGRGELTLDGQVHQLAPMVVAHLPKGTVRAIEAVDGPLAYLSGPPPPAGGPSGGSAGPATLSARRSRGEAGTPDPAALPLGHDAESFMTLHGRWRPMTEAQDGEDLQNTQVHNLAAAATTLLEQAAATPPVGRR